MSPNLSAFVNANQRLPVIKGRAIGHGGRGAVYTLSDGKAYTLTRDECEAMPKHLPWWKGLEG